MAGRIKTGMAGWVFDGWRGGTFYPRGLKAADELAWASRNVTTIEINATFYKLQEPASFVAWAAAAPEDFVFTVKGPQAITHHRRLKDVAVPLANFLASGVLALGSRLGPICWQLPGNFKYDRERVATFLSGLPRTPKAALALARQHDVAVGTPFLATSGVKRLRHAIEVRHESFAVPEFIADLRQHNVALVVADTKEWPYGDQTADFTYCRLQGAPGKEKYTQEDLVGWADRLAALAAGTPIDLPQIGTAPVGKGPRDVFAFFVATDKPHAPANAMTVARRLNIAPSA